MRETLRIHPANPKLFEYDGKPLMLLTATEHYGAVMNRPFRFEPYLEDAALRGHTMTRLFVLFRELQTVNNPYSTCKPESPDYIAPFARTGPGMALDCQPKYDLDKWDPEFFERLHAFIGLAEELGIVVEVVLFGNGRAGTPQWEFSPLNTANNVNGTPAIHGHEYQTRRSEAIWAWQARHAHKIVEELNPYSNVLYEICNEPMAFPEEPQAPTTREEVDAWQADIAALIRETEQDLPRRHVIAGSPCWHLIPQFLQPCDVGFDDLPVEVVNVHAAPDTWLRGRNYDMGAFMAGQLRLEELRDFTLACWREGKAMNHDEDNAASQYKDLEGWTIHRKRAWTALLGGAHYDYIDFSIINYCETGTEASRAAIRSWFGHLSRYVHALDLLRARPIEGWLKEWPEHTCPSVFGVPDVDLTIYLADKREPGEPGAGEPIAGRVGFAIPAGPAWEMSAYAPTAGRCGPWVAIEGGDVQIDVPRFEHDIVIRVRRHAGSRSMGS